MEAPHQCCSYDLSHDHAGDGRRNDDPAQQSDPLPIATSASGLTDRSAPDTVRSTPSAVFGTRTSALRQLAPDRCETPAVGTPISQNIPLR